MYDSVVIVVVVVVLSTNCIYLLNKEKKMAISMTLNSTGTSQIDFLQI